MAKPQIEPRILKGFRDLLPNEAETRISLFELIREVFTGACYLPIDTPALEFSEILLGKGSDETDKQLFRFKDQGDRDVALRFDLTVPLARFASQHRNEINFPFRRYHIAPVWRAEKPQKGRYREFYQCDFDIIGTKGITSDIETLLLISQIFEKIRLKYKVRLNHRVILNGLIEKFASSKNQTSVLRAIDKLEKLGEEIVTQELIKEAELDHTQATNLLSLISNLKNESK
jgi:histidyl-tRNA synthetase